MVALPEPVTVPPVSSWGGAMVAAVLGALGRPSTWPVALLGFLVRGGIVVVALPIVVLPSTIGIANAIAPTLTPFVFGQSSPAFVALVGLVVAGLTGWVIGGGLIGAWADLWLVRAAASDEDLGVALVECPGAVWRALAVRLLAHVPLAIALAWGATRIVDAAYRELILPDELTTPIVLRVLRDVPDAVVAVVGAWLFGETAGGLAQRRLWTSGASIPGSLAWAAVRFVRRPLPMLATLVVTTGGVVLGALVPALVAGVAWFRLRAALGVDGATADVALLLCLFVVLWLLALVLGGAVTAWRSFAWTAESILPARSPRTVRHGGTNGEVEGGRPGEWPSAGTSGSL
jgi:hypothetical protein